MPEPLSPLQAAVALADAEPEVIAEACQQKTTSLINGIDTRKDDQIRFFNHSNANHAEGTTIDIGGERLMFFITLPFSQKSLLNRSK
ncbi:MAG: hypothetical protein ACR2RF_00140 [Geminicoccaceae bacterium]